MRPLRVFQKPPQRSPQRGLSLVELMVGMALGLVIVSLAMLALSQSLRESRQLALGTRVTHELHTAARLIAAELRRTGYWNAAASGVWQAGEGEPARSPHPPGALHDGAWHFSYTRHRHELPEIVGRDAIAYRLRSGAVEARWGEGPWQALTDPTGVYITAFEITPQTQRIPLGDLCSRPCEEPGSPLPTNDPSGSSGSGCPALTRQTLTLHLQARARHDDTLQRAVHLQVNARNAQVSGHCPP